MKGGWGLGRGGEYLMRDAQWVLRSLPEKSLEIPVSVVVQDQKSLDISGGRNKFGMLEFFFLSKDFRVYLA